MAANKFEKNNFENMSAEDIAIGIFYASENASDADAAFETLKSLDTAARKNAVDALEKVAIKDTREFAQEFKLIGPLGMADALGDLLSDDEAEAAELLADSQGTAQIFLRIAEAKGDEAHPVTKALVKEFSKLSDADYNDVVKLLGAVVKGFDKAKAAEAASKPVSPTPNPFRKPKAPGM